MVRKVLVLITVAIMAAVFMVPACVFAKEEPVKIGNWQELKAFIDGVNDGSIAADQDAVLTADIDVPDEVGNDWVPLGKDMDHAYQGVFDGANNTISGIDVDRSDAYPDPWKEGTKIESYTAFCSFLGEKGVVKDLSVTAYIVDVNDAAGIVSQNSGRIEYCDYEGWIKSNIYPNEGSGKSPFYPEGVFEDSDSESGCIAAVNNGIIEGCTTSTRARLIRGGVLGGGIVGSQRDGGIVKDCMNYASVTLSDTKYKVDGIYEGAAGGIVGGQEMVGEAATGARVNAVSIQAIPPLDHGFLAKVPEHLFPKMDVYEEILSGDDGTPRVRGSEGENVEAILDPAKRPLIEGCENYGTVKSYQLAGGICGESRCGDIKNCVNCGNVDEVEGNWAGGIVGYATTKPELKVEGAPEISGCYNYAEINPSAAEEFEDTGYYYGTYIGGICGHLADGSNMKTGAWAPVKLHNCVNYGDVRGMFGVGGVFGMTENGTDGTTKEGFVYEIVNVGFVRGNQDVAGIAGACPGVVADAVNYGPVKLSPVDDSTHYQAGGIGGECGQTARITTSYNIGRITKSGVPAKKVYLGGIAGAATSSQVVSCYYAFQKSGKVTGSIGVPGVASKGALAIRDMSGDTAKTTMEALFKGTSSAHAGTKWIPGEATDVDGVTYYMPPQIESMEIRAEDIRHLASVPTYPVAMSYAVVTAASKTYNGNDRQPTVKVKMGGVELPADAYKVQVIPKTCKSAGTYEVLVIAKGDYKGTATGTYKILKAAQKFKYVGPLVKSIKAGSSFKLTATLSKGKGRISFAKTSGNAYIKINKSGQVTVGSKITKGKTYKVKVKVTADAKDNYRKTSTIETLVINVKK